ncbi:molybdenum cofactor cytidylyltransferase [Evansella vedderi]|uniref:Molybdenum cofactor cytidylyltransferase n=1 Tax=Evansella vedderi TaxID=38282 RepID=A0ABT9ZNX0_9BACI|nr:nucleotidyltransferase family protein [Evansella vedderi]MDQ0252889.1 molybdenum cofactor cytidylyltransferase [Evansella vedderi]
MRQHFGAVLLAAGCSSRMGEMKGLLPWAAGQKIIEYQLEQLRKSRIAEIVVVVGHDADKIIPVVEPFEVAVIQNKDYQQGKSLSIRVGVSKLTDTVSGIIIIAMDQPVSHYVIDGLIVANEKNDSPITVPVYKGKRGHPILFSSRLRTDILNIQEQTFGLRQVVGKYRSQIAEVEVADPSIHFNLNTPQDYYRAKNKLNG